MKRSFNFDDEDDNEEEEEIRVYLLVGISPKIAAEHRLSGAHVHWQVAILFYLVVEAPLNLLVVDAFVLPLLSLPSFAFLSYSGNVILTF